MPFFDRFTVLDDLELQKDLAGLVRPATLGFPPDFDSGNNVALKNVFIHSVLERSGIGSDSASSQRGPVIIWYTGGTADPPRADCTVTRNGKVYNIESVQPMLNDEEELGYARYDCQAVRKA